jgi:hypothetical protein
MSNHSRRAILAGIAASPALAAPAMALTDPSADAELLALSPELELIIRDYSALQSADDWAEVDPDLERWSVMHDRMHPLVDRIMNHRPKTIAGLGMLMRAASLSYDDYERHNDGGNRHGNLISAVCAFCGIEAVATDHEAEEAEDGPCHEGDPQTRDQSPNRPSVPNRSQ